VSAPGASVVAHSLSMNIKRRVQRLVRTRDSDEAPNVMGEARLESGSPPPRVPEGWRLGPPDYIGIGVQKAGTTRWWKLIVAHPDVVGDELKETHQLSRFGWRPLFDEDREAYYRYFPRPQGATVGEWTPRYMNVPGVVEAMKALAPDAKLLVLLRDPVERYRSGVGHWQEHKERRGKRLNLWAGRKDAYARSFYGFALRPYVEAFGLDRMLVLQFEKCLADPAGEYQRTLEFLGLEDWAPPAEILGQTYNVSGERPSPATLDGPPDLVESLEADVRELLTFAPEIDLALWPNFRHLDR
jgi:hypothetical protein